jgi:hypothetical protein
MVASIGRIRSKGICRVLNGEHAATLGAIISIAKSLDIEPKLLYGFKLDLEKE